MRGVFYVTVAVLAVLLVDGCRRWSIVADSSPERAAGARLRLAAKTTAAAFAVGAIAIGVDLLARLGL